MAGKGIRQRKKETAREHILSVATSLFLSKGFEDTTVGEIAQAAGISQRTFFRYFPSKEAVVFHDVPRRRDAMRMMLTAGGDGISPFERIKNCMALMAVDYSRNRESMLAEYTIVSKSTSLQSIMLATDEEDIRLFAKCLRTGRGRARLTKRQSLIMGAAVFAALRVLVWEWVEGGSRASMRGALRDGMLFIDGLAATLPDRHVEKPAAPPCSDDAFVN